MGRTADLYQRLLRQELWEEEYNTKLGVYKGELVTVSDQKMQDAIRKVQKKINRLVPSKKKAAQKFRRFCDQQNEVEQRKGAVHDAESKKRYGDGIKFQQYQKNKDALVKQAAETLRREIAWNNALVRCGLSADQAAKMVDGNARWMKLLMRTGTDAESLAHNDKIMTLLAFGRKQISADEFVSKRVNQCKEYENRNDADAQVLADQEKNSVGNVLWDEVRQVAGQSRRATEDQASYATMVLTGKAGKNKKPSVDQCYRSLGSAAALMCLDLEFCFVSVSAMDGFTNAAEKKKYVGDIQFQTFHDHTTEAYLDFAANPYFCVVDPFKMNAVNETTENTLNNVLPKGQEGTVEAELDEALVNECNQIYFNWINQQRKALAPFGLGIDDQVEYRTNDRTVFKDPDGHMCIVRQLKLDERGPVIVDAFHPEDLVDADMKPELDKFLHTCKKWDRKHYTSDQFENMRTDLENLAEADKLGYAPGEYDIKSLEDRVKSLQETSRLYLEKKQRETPNGHYKRGYETRRVAFATKLNQFAEKKLKELGYVRAHMATLEASRKAERDLKNDPDFIKTKETPKFSEMTALQYQRKKQQDERTAEARRREAEEKRQRVLEDERKEKLKREEHLQVGREVRNQIQDLRKDIKEPSKDKENAKKLVDAYLEKEKADYAPLHDARGKQKNVMEKFPLTDKEEAQAKRIFAGNVMREMLEAENDPSRNPSQDFKAHEMINGGKLQQLAKTIMTFPKFEEVYAANRPNTKNNMDMVIESTNPLLHRNANTVLTAMNASIDLAAEEEKKNQAEAQEKPEEEKKAEEGPNKPVEDPQKEDEKPLEEKADEKPVEVKTKEVKNEEVKKEEGKKDGKEKSVKRENMPLVSKQGKSSAAAKPQKKVVIPSDSTTVKQQAETKDPRDEHGLYSLKLNSEYSDLLGISEGWELFGDKKEIYAKSSEQMQLHLDKTGVTAPPRKMEQKRSVDDCGLKPNKMNWQELVREEEKHGKEDENFRKFSKSSDAKARSDMRRQNMEREFFQDYQAYCGDDKNKIVELNSNDISVLRKLENSSNDPKLKQYLDHRIQGLKKIEACAKKANANPENRMDGTQKIDNDKVELEGVPLKRVQTTEHGCWAVALSNMLAYRGVYLEQDAIRTFRPDVNSYSAEDIADANKDRSQCIAQYSDLVQKVLPNTAVNHALCVVDQANSEAEAKAQIKKKLSSVIERGLKQDNGPVALLTGNHYLTVYKMEGDQVFVQDSMDSQKPTRAMSLETLADSCSTGSYKNNDSGNDINRYVFSADWLQDIEVNKEGKPMLKGELEQFADTYRQGNTKDQGHIFAGAAFNSDQYHGCQFKTKDDITITSVLPTNFKNYRKLTKDSFTDVQKDIVKDVKKAQTDGLRRTKSFSDAQSGKKL